VGPILVSASGNISARELADHALSLSTSEQINRFINTEMRSRFPSDFDRDLAFGEKNK
jgi:phosphotransferase system enzyme I (PtsI)